MKSPSESGLMSSVVPELSSHIGRLRRIAAFALAGAIAAAVLAGTADAREPRSLKFKPAEKSKTARQAKKELSPPAPPGPHLLVVSINKQRVTLYSNGKPVAVSPVSTGTATHPTPTGVFSIIQKNRHHRSNIYSNAPMPFMQRLTWSGVALHEGKLPGYPASHGCIRLPGISRTCGRTTNSAPA